MRNTKRALAIIFNLLLLSSAAFAQHGRRSVNVMVIDAKKQPLEACITFVPKEGEIIFHKTGRDGKLTVKNLLPGDYRVVAKVDGYGATKQEVTIREDMQQQSLLFMFLSRDQ